jgi:hypothetical protein
MTNTLKLQIPDDDSDTIVIRGGIKVAFNRGGGLTVYSNGDVKVRPAVNDDAKPRAKTAPEIGQLVEGKGVYVGTWTPKDRVGNSLGKTFNLFAAPYDLGLDENGNGIKLVTTYKKAVTAVGKITNLLGFAGFRGKNDTDLYNALRDGSYKGEWFIPTKDILCGKDVDGNAVQNDHLFGHRNTGALAGTFTTVKSGSDNAPWYWSCTELASYSSLAWHQRFTDGGDGWGRKDYYELFVRCVRAELRP